MCLEWLYASQHSGEPTAAVTVADMPSIIFVNVEIEHIATQYRVVGTNVVGATNPCQRKLEDVVVDGDGFLSSQDDRTRWAECPRFRRRC